MIILLVCLLSVVDRLTALSDDAKMLSKAELKFSTELFQKTAEKNANKNILISSYSVYSTLLTLYLSSAGKTTEIIEDVVRFDHSFKPSQSYISDEFFHEVPKNNTKDYNLLSFDRIFIGQALHKRSGPRKKVTKKRDHKKNSKKGLEDDINNWVSVYTEGRIKKILEEGAIKKDETFIIVNVAFFNGQWKVPLAGGTTEKPFVLSDGANTKTLFMSAKNKPFQFLTDKDLKAQAISLPYKGDDIVMIIILPTTKPKKNSPSPIAEVIKKLTDTTIEKIVSALQTQKMTKIDLFIPKFVSEETCELKPIFEALGDKKLFTESLIMPVYFKKGTEVKVNRIVHKAKAEVSEYGTEGSAASAMMGVKLFVPEQEYAATPAVTADQPFAYIIYDKKQSLVHFMGILNKPKEVKPLKKDPKKDKPNKKDPKKDKHKKDKPKKH